MYLGACKANITKVSQLETNHPFLRGPWDLWLQLCLSLLSQGSRGHPLLGNLKVFPHRVCLHTSLNKCPIVLPVTHLFTGLDFDKHLFIQGLRLLCPCCHLHCLVMFDRMKIEDVSDTNPETNVCPLSCDFTKTSNGSSSRCFCKFLPPCI